MTRQKTVGGVISKISERPSSSNAALVIICGRDLGRKYDLGKGESRIGRNRTCEIQLDQELVSRNHATITSDGERLQLRDLESTNGTYVNDSAVRDCDLRSGDYLKIGRTIFKVLGGGNIESAYHDEIYQLTTIDGLTQIFNKRYFLQVIEQEVLRGGNLALIMFDIDHFKKINDGNGHLAGDHVLRQVAVTIQGAIRQDDVFARYGGEEFAILLKQIAIPGAVALAEKMRKLVEKTSFQFGSKKLPVTISVGVAQLPKGITQAEALIGSADEKLYQAKRGGRNRVCS